MSSPTNDRRAVVLVSSMILLGLGLLTIPWFLIPPAYLELALRDSVFAADLNARRVTVTDEITGRSRTAAIQRIGSSFVVRIGRINSGKGAYRAQIPGYKPGTARIDAAALQHLRASIDLLPTFGRLELSPVNATRRDEAIAATVRNGTRSVTTEARRPVVLDLPPGTHKFVADASGFCPAEREFQVREAKVTKAVLPLSPDLRDDEIARFVLGWRNEPQDLDSHFRKSDAVGFPHPAHLFWRQKTAALPNGDAFARLDVDELNPGRYETVTVRSNAMGEFRYFVHRFSRVGEIKDADATVQVYTRGCSVRSFSPPPGCSAEIWNVATLRYSGDGVDLSEIQTCERAFGPRVLKND